MSNSHSQRRGRVLFFLFYQFKAENDQSWVGDWRKKNDWGSMDANPTVHLHRLWKRENLPTWENYLLPNNSMHAIETCTLSFWRGRWRDQTGTKIWRVTKRMKTVLDAWALSFVKSCMCDVSWNSCSAQQQLMHCCSTVMVGRISFLSRTIWPCLLRENFWV